MLRNFLIGHGPVTTIAAYILSALLVVQQLEQKGIYDWRQMILPIAIAVLGRLAGDDHPLSGRKLNRNGKTADAAW